MDVSSHLRRNLPGENGSTIEITKDEVSPALVAEQFMEVEFGFGFGFGKRIKKIAYVTEEPKRFILEGEIQLWRADVSRFRMETDQNYVIRKAMIDADVDGNLTRYEVETEGAVEKDGFVFAKNGHVKRSSQGMRKDGNIIGKPKVLKEFDLRFEEVRFNLPDVEYARFTNMDVPPDTMLVDRSTGERVYVDSEGRKQSLDQPNRPAGPSFNRLYLHVVMIHLSIVLMLALIVWWRKRVKASVFK